MVRRPWRLLLHLLSGAGIEREDRPELQPGSVHAATLAPVVGRIGSRDTDRSCPSVPLAQRAECQLCPRLHHDVPLGPQDARSLFHDRPRLRHVVRPARWCRSPVTGGGTRALRMGGGGRRPRRTGSVHLDGADERVPPPGPACHGAGAGRPGVRPAALLGLGRRAARSRRRLAAVRSARTGAPVRRGPGARAMETRRRIGCGLGSHSAPVRRDVAACAERHHDRDRQLSVLRGHPRPVLAPARCPVGPGLACPSARRRGGTGLVDAPPTRRSAPSNRYRCCR